MNIKMNILVAVLIGLIPLVNAEEVILVSDNHADMAGALGIADLINATLITTPWGIYDEKIVEQIKTLNPKKVIIIGGSIAVVEHYENGIKSFGIEVERIGGRNRFETNQMLFYRFRDRIRNISIAVCYGYDDIALNESINMHKIVVLANRTDITVPLMQYGIMHAEIVHSPMFNITPIRLRIQNGGINVTLRVLAEERIKLMLKNQIEHTRAKIEFLRSLNIDTKELEEDLENIETLYELGEYDKAYSAIIELKHKLMFSIRQNTGMGMQREMPQRGIQHMGMQGGWR